MKFNEHQWPWMSMKVTSAVSNTCLIGVLTTMRSVASRDKNDWLVNYLADKKLIFNRICYSFNSSIQADRSSPLKPISLLLISALCAPSISACDLLTYLLTSRASLQFHYTVFSSHQSFSGVLFESNLFANKTQNTTEKRMTGWCGRQLFWKLETECIRHSSLVKETTIETRLNWLNTITAMRARRHLATCLIRL